jgi:hypothetical protein
MLVKQYQDHQSYKKILNNKAMPDIKLIDDKYLITKGSAS